MGYPNMPPPPPLPGGWQEADPGFIPLHPMTTGRILATAAGVVRRHWWRLIPLGMLFAAAAATVETVAVQRSGIAADLLSGKWSADITTALEQGRAPQIPTVAYAIASAYVAIPLLGALLIAGIAAACIGADAISRSAPIAGSIGRRARASVGTLIATGVIVTVATSLGLLVLIAPGILAFAILAIGTPAAVMEHAGTGRALGRAARLSRGHRWRLLGTVALTIILSFVAQLFVSSAALSFAGTADPLDTVLISGIAGAVVAALTVPWVGAVIALIYVDIRLRTENLGSALRAAAGD